MELVVVLPELPPSIDALFVETSLVGRDCDVVVAGTRTTCHVVAGIVTATGRVSLTVRVPVELLEAMSGVS